MLLEISFLYVEACALRHAKYKCTKSYLVLLAVLLEADLEKSKFFFRGVVVIMHSHMSPVERPVRQVKLIA